MERLITDHGAITEKVYNALEKAAAAGWEVIIASGRTLFAAKPIIEKLPFVQYAVLNNGARIINMHNLDILYEEKLSSELAKDIIKVIRNHNSVPVLYNTHIENQKIFYDTLENACEYFTWFIQKDSRCVHIDDVMNYTDDVMQISTVADKELILEIKESTFEIRCHRYGIAI